MTWRFLSRGGMAAQLSLLVVAAVVVVHASVTLGLHWLEKPLPPPGFIEQVAAEIRALEAVPAADRQAVAAAFAGTRLTDCAAGEFTAAPSQPPPPPEFLADLRQSLAEGIGTRPLAIVPLSGQEPPRLRLTIELSWGQCAHLDLPPPPPRHGLSLGRMMVPMEPLLLLVWSMALLVALLSVWASWRVTRPLARLAESADRLGREGQTAPLAEDGPREIRQAAHAFNLMQERLHRFVESRTRMLAAISHDYRTILTRLRLRAATIADVDLQSRMLRDFARMETMVESTLAFVRDDRQQEPVEWVDLPSLLTSLCDQQGDLGEPVSYHGPDSLRCRCRIGGLERAVGNLLDNAIKYGGAVRVVLTQPRSDMVEIAVEDDGPGIPPEEREKVFDPFYRLDRARTADKAGVGLGLSIARGIVTAHGGQITLDGRSPHGTIARIHLPLGGG